DGIRDFHVTGVQTCALPILFFDRKLSEDFAYRCKQAGQLASKMRFLSAPWLGILENDVWLKHARHANAMAQRLAAGLQQVPGARSEERRVGKAGRRAWWGQR